MSQYGFRYNCTKNSDQNLGGTRIEFGYGCPICGFRQKLPSMSTKNLFFIRKMIRVGVNKNDYRIRTRIRTRIRMRIWSIPDHTRPHPISSSTLEQTPESIRIRTCIWTSIRIRTRLRTRTRIRIRSDPDLYPDRFRIRTRTRTRTYTCILKHIPDPFPD